MKEFNLNDFMDNGILQEVNRQFFHPLGLALAVDVDDDGSVTGLACVFETDDPEGIAFMPPDPVKAAAFQEYAKGRAPKRLEGLGWIVEPDGCEP